MKFKADTVEQYKIYKHLLENFYIDNLIIEKVDRNCLKVKDKDGETEVFWLSSEGTVEYGARSEDLIEG